MIPRLYLVAARELFGCDEDWLAALERVARAACEQELTATALQVRIEPLYAGVAEQLAREALACVRRVERTSRLRVYLNAPGCNAPALGYDAAHWPERFVQSWRNAGGGLARDVAAASVHSPAAVQDAEAIGVHFVVFGAVWEPTWKHREARGLESLHEVCAVSKLPVLAIGGVTPERVALACQAGAYGVAVAGSVFRAVDPAAALADFSRVFGQEGPDKLPDTNLAQ